MSGPFTKRHLSRTTVQTYTTTTQGPVLGAGKAVPESDLEFRRLKDNFASLRLGVRAAVTVPSSVRYRVSRERPESNMARPRSPQKKNDVDHEQMQLLLDQQLSDIRQQLVSTHAHARTSIHSLTGLRWLALTVVVGVSNDWVCVQDSALQL